MLYKAKVAVRSDIRTKHSTQSERHVEFLDVKPGGTEKKGGYEVVIRFIRYIRKWKQLDKSQ